MTAAAQKITKQALALPEKERLKLVRLLSQSLPEEAETLSQEEWDKAWKKELEKRIEEMESGEDLGVPLEAILDDLQKLGGKLCMLS
jgi:putative addiction module component (TIGR02574 family)